ncbi:hypothetical protein HY486_01035 [Candidatus Woesearchaeota archaeon]|nr:hypothetical protein [Candidatus Woesearchaeota archaeon]
MKSAVVALALETLKNGKQALVFVNAKRSAEKEAEDISDNIKGVSCNDLSSECLKALSQPTKQCEKLSKCLQKGIAFHHSGLHYKQKSLVEESFRNGKIKIICCTPTLAAGLDLPAFRAIIRDLKRFDSFGMSWIPVLEYHQMAGRAGRPSFDSFGEAIVIAKSQNEADRIVEDYINGVVENVLSKLAVEPVLRTYILSLIVTGIASTESMLVDFFSRSFWAYQYKDMVTLKAIIQKMVGLLSDIGMIVVSARIEPTRLGQRVAELYIDPLTAHHLRTNMGDSVHKELYSLCCCTELNPLFSVRTTDYETLNEFALRAEIIDYDENSLKTAVVLNDWVEERNEAFIFEHRNISPGELHAKLEKAVWICYSAGEIARICSLHEMYRQLVRLRLRLENGIKEDLLNLIRFKGIGRVRARKLYNAGIKTAGDVKKAEFDVINNLLGHAMAQSLKKQVESAA